MKIAYVVNARIPTEKAHGYQICKMCEEFSNLGVEVELMAPTRFNIHKEDVFSFYDVKKNFNIKKIKSFDFIKYEKFFFKKGLYLQALYYLIKLFFLKFNKKKILIYTRNPEIAWLFKMKGCKVVFEAHYWPVSGNFFYKLLLKKVDLIVCNSRGTEKEHSKNGFTKTIVARNGVDLEKFNIPELKEEFREELNFKKEDKIVMYVGHLYEWKGVDVVLNVAKLSDDDRIKFVFVGGADKDVENYRKNNQLSNVLFLGQKKKEHIPKILKCADILLLPNIPVSEESFKYTSPIKMFEYMASKKPVIASDLPSIREVLNKENSVLVESGNPEEIISSINKLLGNQDLYNKIAKQAFSDVAQYTWENRAKKILKMINNLKIK